MRSSPTRPEPTRLVELIEEVVEPYRAGLAGRIAVAVSALEDLPTVTIDRTLFARVPITPAEPPRMLPEKDGVLIKNRVRQAALMSE